MSRPHKVNTYLDTRELWLLRELTRARDRSEAYILRDGLNLAAQQDLIREPTPEELAALDAEIGAAKRARDKGDTNG